MSITVPNTFSMLIPCFDYWLPRLSDIEFRLFIFIVRKISEWPSCPLVADIVQIMQVCGFPLIMEEEVKKALEKLEENFLIKIKRVLTSETQTIYHINVQKGVLYDKNSLP